MLQNLYAQGTTVGAQQPNLIATMIPFILIFAILYFFMIKPQAKKQKELEDMRKSLQKGDKVLTIGGIIGTITNFKQNGAIVTLAISDNVKVDFAIDAITTKLIDKKNEGENS